jgi:hypothetical protein
MPEEKSGLISTALELVQPSFLSGYTFPHWIRLLRSNDWAVDGKYIPRALMATIGALATSALKPLEPEIELDAESEEMSRKPFFILGLNRSGTTHLFNLLAQTGAFGFPARLDCYNPHTFLLLRQIGLHRLLAKVPRKKRKMDNVETGWLLPEEDCIAMQILGESCSVFLPFPRQWDFVSAWRSPYGDSQTAKMQFCNGLRNFSKKLVHLHRRPLLFKSPSHTSAIPEILSVFPEARFITILRNPFDQFASLAALHRNPKRGFFVLQAPRRIEDEEMLEGIRSVITRYLESRPAIAGPRLIEIRYEKLVSNPDSTLQEIQSRFGLLADCMNRTQWARPYVRNTHAEIPEAVKVKLRKIYQPCIDAGLFDPEELT